MFFAFWISARNGPFMFQNIISSTKAAKTVRDECGFSGKDAQLCVFGKGDNKDPFQCGNAGLVGHAKYFFIFIFGVSQGHLHLGIGANTTENRT